MLFKIKAISSIVMDDGVLKLNRIMEAQMTTQIDLKSPLILIERNSEPKPIEKHVQVQKHVLDPEYRDQCRII